MALQSITSYNNEKQSWQERQENISLYDLHAQLKPLKADRETLKKVHSQVLQNVGVRLELAFQAFFRRVKSGDGEGLNLVRRKWLSEIQSL